MAPAQEGAEMIKNDVFASTEERLRHGRQIAENAQRLSEAIDQQASKAQELSDDSDRIIGKAQAVLHRADALTDDYAAQTQAAKPGPEEHRQG